MWRLHCGLPPLRKCRTLGVKFLNSASDWKITGIRCSFPLLAKHYIDVYRGICRERKGKLKERERRVVGLQGHSATQNVNETVLAKQQKNIWLKTFSTYLLCPFFSHSVATQNSDQFLVVPVSCKHKLTQLAYDRKWPHRYPNAVCNSLSCVCLSKICNLFMLILHHICPFEWKTVSIAKHQHKPVVLKYIVPTENTFIKDKVILTTSIQPTFSARIFKKNVSVQSFGLHLWWVYRRLWWK